MSSCTSAGGGAAAGAGGGALSLLMALSAMKMAAAMIRKSKADCRNAPYLSSTGSPAGLVPRSTARSEKLTPPTTLPSSGITTSPTNDDTILPKAPPITTPTAMSTTLPFIANSLNSDIMLIVTLLGDRPRGHGRLLTMDSP